VHYLPALGSGVAPISTYHQDADYMKSWRAMGQLLEEPPQEELWETAFQIA
jgi:hypothetical protein